MILKSTFSETSLRGVMLERSVMMTDEDCKCIPNLEVMFVKALTRPPIFGLGFVYVGC